MPRIRFFWLGVTPMFLKFKHTCNSVVHRDSRPFTKWHALYVAALFEKDEGRMLERIQQAKTALVVRARELFLTDGDHQQEQADIDDALQFLHVLEKCTLRPHAAH